jgi:hypothetical protein
MAEPRREAQLRLAILSWTLVLAAAVIGWCLFDAAGWYGLVLGGVLVALSVTWSAVDLLRDRITSRPPGPPA